MEFFVLENRTYRRESKSFILLMKLSNVISLSAIDCPYSLFSHSVEEVVCGEWAFIEEEDNEICILPSSGNCSCSDSDSAF